MHPFHVMLTLFGALALVGFGYVVRWERRQFLARGLGRPWLWVRLATIPAAAASAALVIIPARQTSGMEGLAVFYLLLLTLAPAVWFGVHAAVGKMASPRLSIGDSARIAASPLVYALALALAAPLLQSPAWSLLRTLGLL